MKRPFYSLNIPRRREFEVTNSRSGAPARRQLTLLDENCAHSGQGGGIICRVTGLKISVIATIREIVN